MSLIVKEFASWLKVARNFSDLTIDTYVRGIDRLDEYIQEITF
jgi:site-specific recombinase XerD